MGTLAASLIASLVGVAVSTATGVAIDAGTDKTLNEPAHLQNVQISKSATGVATQFGTNLLKTALTNIK